MKLKYKEHEKQRNFYNDCFVYGIRKCQGGTLGYRLRLPLDIFVLGYLVNFRKGTRKFGIRLVEKRSHALVRKGVWGAPARERVASF